MMTELLEHLREIVEKCTENMLLPVNADTGRYEDDSDLPTEPEDGYAPPQLFPLDETQRGDEPTEGEAEPEDEVKQRPPDVYLMNLPEREDLYSNIPYILIQGLNAKDKLDQDTMARQTLAEVRIIIVTWNPDGQDGGLQVWRIIEKLRIVLEEGELLGDNFQLKYPFDAQVYPDDTGDYYLGEINTNFTLPTIQRTRARVEDYFTKENPDWTIRF